MKSYSISQRKKSRGNKTWYGREFEDGFLVKEISLKTKNKKDAQDWLNAMNASRFMPEAIQARISPKDHDIETAISSFMKSVEASGGSGSRTLSAYGSRLGRWKDWCHTENIATLRAFTPEMAVLFSASISQSLAPKTQRELTRCVRQFCSWSAETFGIENWNPFKSVKPPKLVKREKKFWSLEQIDMILEKAPSPDHRLFWSLMAFAGLRFSEALNFGASSVTTDNEIRFIGKGNKEAFLPIGERLKEEMSRMEIHDGMFKSSRFKHSDRINIALRKAVEDAGLDPKGCTNHTFRHSFASNLIRSDVNAKAVQELMRHEDIKVTLDTYSHLFKEDLSKSVNALKKTPGNKQESFKEEQDTES